MDILKNQWRSTGGICISLLTAWEQTQKKTILFTIIWDHESRKEPDSK